MALRPFSMTGFERESQTELQFYDSEILFTPFPLIAAQTPGTPQVSSLTPDLFSSS